MTIRLNDCRNQLIISKNKIPGCDTSYTLKKQRQVLKGNKEDSSWKIDHFIFRER